MGIRYANPRRQFWFTFQQCERQTCKSLKTESNPKTSSLSLLPPSLHLYGIEVLRLTHVIDRQDIFSEPIREEMPRLVCNDPGVQILGRGPGGQMKDIRNPVSCCCIKQFENIYKITGLVVVFNNDYCFSTHNFTAHYHTHNHVCEKYVSTLNWKNTFNLFVFMINLCHILYSSLCSAMHVSVNGEMSPSGVS